MVKIRDDLEKILDCISNDCTRAIFRFKFSSLSIGRVMPNEGHPNAEMHEHAGKELAAFIKDIVLK
jgi:hypothetical protein